MNKAEDWGCVSLFKVQEMCPFKLDVRESKPFIEVLCGHKAVHTTKKIHHYYKFPIKNNISVYQEIKEVIFATPNRGKLSVISVDASDRVPSCRAVLADNKSLHFLIGNKRIIKNELLPYHVILKKTLCLHEKDEGMRGQFLEEVPLCN